MKHVKSSQSAGEYSLNIFEFAEKSACERISTEDHVLMFDFRECGAETFVNFASFERDGKLPYNW